MSKEAFTIAYSGPALDDGAMDVRDLAPALMALGQLLDAANQNLNGDAAQIKLQVKATKQGRFEISFEFVQNWSTQVLHFFASPEASGATNLLNWVLGITGVPSLLWLIKRFSGKSPTAVEKLRGNKMRLTLESESVEVPLELLRLYQDVAVRIAAQKLIEEPLKHPGITSFSVKKDGVAVETVTKEDAVSFAKPALPDEVLIDDVRRSAFSIVALAFKDDNKWRLSDGNTQISVSISDAEFLRKVDVSQISFTKGDILICHVRVTQRRTPDGLKTDHVVEKVVEHRPAARQLPLPFVRE